MHSKQNMLYCIQLSIYCHNNFMQPTSINNSNMNVKEVQICFGVCKKT